MGARGIFAAVIAFGLAAPSQDALAASDMACRAVTLIDRTTGETIVGPEDIAVDYDANLAYISAYDRRKVEEEVGAGEAIITPGGIYLLDLNALSPLASSVTVEDLTQEFKQGADFRPHGIDLLLGSGGDQLLAVNRAYVSNGQGVRLNPAIERFRVEEGGLLAHIETLRPRNDKKLMCSPNDVLALGDDRFLVTNDHGSCGGFGRFWEEAWGNPDAHVVLYEDGTFRKAIRYLSYPNGLALYKNDDEGDLLVIAETRGEELSLVDPSVLRGSDQFSLGISLPGSPDNLSWAEDGRLLVAVIPDITEFGFNRRGWFGVESSASRIVAVSPPFFGANNKEVIFEDDGSLISAATVMADARDVRLIGSVLDDHIVVCNKANNEALIDE